LKTNLSCPNKDKKLFEAFKSFSDLPTPHPHHVQASNKNLHVAEDGKIPAQFSGFHTLNWKPLLWPPSPDAGREKFPQ
jgi:hypothetical protein